MVFLLICSPLVYSFAKCFIFAHLFFIFNLPAGPALGPAQPASLLLYNTLCRSQKSCRKPYIVQNPKSGLPHTFFLFTFVCIYTNKYNILCRFYVILFGHFYIKKYNSVPLYFIASKFNKMSKLKKDIKYNGTLLYFLM